LCGGITPAGSESYIETKAVRHYTQNQQPPAPEKSIKTQGDSPRKHRTTKKLKQQEENTHPLENHGNGKNCTGPTTSTLTTCELIQLQAQ